MKARAFSSSLRWFSPSFYGENFTKEEEDFARICALLSLSRHQVRERTALERKKTDVNAFGSCDDVVL